MGKINVLSKNVAELIAAGEVVERPASVIKEMAENSVDAGATQIVIEIQHGGITYIRVTDNGSGIMRDDIKNAFLRHATSKIKEQDDLDSISTLGFRGEALASICAVAKVSLLTKTADELSGTSYIIEGGEEVSLSDAGCPVGTTIIVRDIFFNTPARMKFLKKDLVEANAVAAVVDKIALSHPEVAVKFIRDGKTALETSGDNKIINAVYGVYGKDLVHELMPVSYELSGVKIHGYISRPSYCRPNRSMQNFFINGRYIRSRTAAVALEEAYKGSIMVGKFPACFIYMEIMPQAVDVNVHPSKIEVRFINERPIFDCVYHAVKSAINESDAPKEVKLPDKKVSDNPFIKNVYSEAPVQNTFPVFKNNAEKPKAPVPDFPRPGKNLEDILGFKTAEKAPEMRDSGNAVHRYKAPEPIEKQPEETPAPTFQELKSLDIPIKVKCEVFDTYIIAEYGKDKLMIIDKHAAHERMLYEKLRETEKINSQALLSPVSVVLGKEEYSAVIENTDVLLKAGFETEDFGAGTVLVRAIPLYIDAAEIESEINEIAGYLVDNKTDITTQKLDWLCHNIACRSAVKAGSESPLAELIDLAKRLHENPQIRYCPHGRPVSVIISKYELDKQFGRV